MGQALCPAWGRSLNLGLRGSLRASAASPGRSGQHQSESDSCRACCLLPKALLCPPSPPSPSHLPSETQASWPLSSALLKVASGHHQPLQCLLSLLILHPSLLECPPHLCPSRYLDTKGLSNLPSGERPEAAWESWPGSQEMSDTIRQAGLGLPKQNTAGPTAGRSDFPRFHGIEAPGQRERERERERPCWPGGCSSLKTSR